MQRYDILQKYINKYKYTKYLEVGTQKNVNFNKIKVQHKTSVDPDPKAGADFVMTSDAFFEQVSEDVTFDIIFLDGLHESPQLYKDINNSLNLLAKGGVIICHDCNPILESEQQVPRISKRWNGNVWMDIVRLRTERTDLKIFTIDSDEGCCVIRKGRSTKLKVNCEVNYRNLERYRKEWLNLITVSEWLSIMGEKVDNYKVWEFIPYSLTKQYGQACNECFELIPNDNDWMIATDADSLYLTPSHIHMVHEAINMHPDTGLFICKTNRVGNRKQVHDMSLFEDMDIKKHRQIALTLAKEPLTFTEMKGDVSGYFLCMKKATWKEIGGFKTTGILGVDTALGRAVRKTGKKILMINNLYKYHYYRYNEGIQYKKHII